MKSFRVLLALAASVLVPAAAHAQVDACSIAGEYVFAGVLLDGPASQVGGTFTFTPPSPCNLGTGTVVVAATAAAPGDSSRPINLTLPYVVSGTAVDIGAGLLSAGVAGVSGGTVTVLAVNGGTSRVAGTLTKRSAVAGFGKGRRRKLEVTR